MGEGERRDLSVWLGKVLGQHYLHRLGAFTYRNDRELSWNEFNIVYASGPNEDKHKWYVDHLGGDPRTIDLDRLEIVRRKVNVERYASNPRPHVLVC